MVLWAQRALSFLLVPCEIDSRWVIRELSRSLKYTQRLFCGSYKTLHSVLLFLQANTAGGFIAYQKLTMVVLAPSSPQALMGVESDVYSILSNVSLNSLRTICSRT